MIVGVFHMAFKKYLHCQLSLTIFPFPSKYKFAVPPSLLTDFLIFMGIPNAHQYTKLKSFMREEKRHTLSFWSGLPHSIVSNSINLPAVS